MLTKKTSLKERTAKIHNDALLMLALHILQQRRSCIFRFISWSSYSDCDYKVDSLSRDGLYPHFDTTPLRERPFRNARNRLFCNMVAPTNSRIRRTNPPANLSLSNPATYTSVNTSTACTSPDVHVPFSRRPERSPKTASSVTGKFLPLSTNSPLKPPKALQKPSKMGTVRKLLRNE
jgi:hypothetical protein